MPQINRNNGNNGNTGHDSSSTVAFVVSESSIIIGNNDLCIFDNQNMDESKNSAQINGGSSDLEGCFGAGMVRNSVEARCLLAGSKSFIIDQLEVWSIN